MPDSGRVSPATGNFGTASGGNQSPAAGHPSSAEQVAGGKIHPGGRESDLKSGPNRRIENLWESGMFSAFKRTYGQLFSSRAALAMLGYSLFMTFTNDNLFVVYGVWLESRFHLSIVSLGMGMIAIGMAELVGSSLAAFFGDRVGLKRAVIGGTIATILCYGLLPLLDQFLLSTLCGIFMLFLIFEFTIVMCISLSTEVLPAARATMISGLYATAGIGRVIGAVTGMSLWMFGELTATVLMSTTLTMLALAILLWGLKGKRL